MPNTEEESPTERQASHCVEILFQTAHGPESVILQTAGDFAAVMLAYACTCHKMQGSEARKVIVVAHSAQTRVLSREWLYTAATRAQNKLIILYNKRGLNKALNRQEIQGQTIAQKSEFFARLAEEDLIKQRELINGTEEEQERAQWYMPLLPDAEAIETEETEETEEIQAWIEDKGETEEVEKQETETHTQPTQTILEIVL